MNAADPNQEPVYPNRTQARRPRGFAATAGGGGTSSNNSTGKREREKEKERTKLRERHRRAITSRMLAGLRQYGNFPLPARADMNDVLAALAREAGWTVEADGTTYRPPHQTVTFPSRSVSLNPKTPLLDSIHSPQSLDSVIAERDIRKTSSSPVDCLDADQLIQEVSCGERVNSFPGSPYVPVYIMLSVGVVNNFCQLADPEGVRQELSLIKSLKADGVVVECWWGIVEAWNPQKYVWSGYRDLFNIIRDFNLKLQVVMAFHDYIGNDSGGVLISLPQWILEIGRDNQDIFFTDRQGKRNTECLSWGVDKERVLRGRTGIEVYFDFMRSFRAEFDDLFAEGLISAVEVGLGTSGELKYPSFSERMGWRYPGIGEFQCYDKYLQQNLQKMAKSRGHSFWAKGPGNTGQYNSRPQETDFFCERGEYDSYYGRFFLNWYSQLLIEHADNVLSLARLAFEEIRIIVKVPAVYWWYRTASHAAELTAGYYNPANHDGYSRVFEVLNKQLVTIKFVSSGTSTHENDEALADPESLSWQVLNSAWDRGLAVAGENELSCYNREGYMRLVNMAKPRNDPDGRCFAFFVYRQPSLSLLQGTISFVDLDCFIKCMHGDIEGGLAP